ncbi:MAG: alpha-1,2-fucosyltransferase [Butyrivibrio sp.]|nr:alpha-1,2-fucosyltransferase [Butyrivibrio sp.]
MIVVRIWEGLGNQLFQYAYARSLQERLDVPVYLDVRHNNRGDLPFERKDIVQRKLGLQHFNISMKMIKTNKIADLRCLDGTGVMDKTRYLLLKKHIGKWSIVDDEAGKCSINADVLSPEDYTYISAHCVNKGYFKSYSDILLKELQLKKGLRLSDDLKKIIEEKNTVSVHIRLTDYLINPLVDPSAILKQSYYDKAIQYIKDKVDNPYFMIFTDDPIMAKNRFQFGDNVYWISKDGYTDYEELILMSKCKHNIIAFSTFSYWGAWLNQNHGKLIVAPKNLFEGRLHEKEWKMI